MRIPPYVMKCIEERVKADFEKAKPQLLKEIANLNAIDASSSVLTKLDMQEFLQPFDFAEQLRNIDVLVADLPLPDVGDVDGFYMRDNGNPL